MRASRIEKCANPDCHAEFKRLGTGKPYSMAVSRLVVTRERSPQTA
jgi:hypothetical protein